MPNPCADHCPPDDWRGTPTIVAGDLAALALSDLCTPTGTGAECSGCGWLIALAESDCLAVSIDGAGTSDFLSSSDGITWTSTTTVTICGVAYTVTFGNDTNPQTLTLTSTGSGSGGSPISGALNCCGCNYATFVFNRTTLCGSGSGSGSGSGTGPAPCDNLVSVRLDWTPCPTFNCTLACTQCPSGTSTIWNLTVLGETIRVTYAGGCTWVSDDTFWTMTYDSGSSTWTVTDSVTATVWSVAGTDWLCNGINTLSDVADAAPDLYASPLFSCSSVPIPDCNVSVSSQICLRFITPRFDLVNGEALLTLVWNGTDAWVWTPTDPPPQLRNNDIGSARMTYTCTDGALSFFLDVRSRVPDVFLYQWLFPAGSRRITQLDPFAYVSVPADIEDQIGVVGPYNFIAGSCDNSLSPCCDTGTSPLVATVTINGHTQAVSLTVSDGVWTGSGTFGGVDHVLTMNCDGSGLWAMFVDQFGSGNGPNTGLAPDGAGNLVGAYSSGADSISVTVPYPCTGSCTPIPGWVGAGWYCATTTGSSDPCVATFLLDVDKCDVTITICSGPYPDETTATDGCTSGSAGCCGTKSLLDVLDVALSGPTDCSGTLARMPGVSGSTWNGDVSCDDSSTATCELFCQDGAWFVSIATVGGVTKVGVVGAGSTLTGSASGAGGDWTVSVDNPCPPCCPDDAPDLLSDVTFGFTVGGDPFCGPDSIPLITSDGDPTWAGTISCLVGSEQVSLRCVAGVWHATTQFSGASDVVLTPSGSNLVGTAGSVVITVQNPCTAPSCPTIVPGTDCVGAAAAELECEYTFPVHQSPATEVKYALAPGTYYFTFSFPGGGFAQTTIRTGTSCSDVTTVHTSTSSGCVSCTLSSFTEVIFSTNAPNDGIDVTWKLSATPC